MKRISTSLVALMAASFFAGTSGATDLLDEKYDPAPSGVSVNWTGISVGVHGGYSNSNHKIEAEGVTSTSICEFSSESQTMVSFGDSPAACDAVDGWLQGPTNLQTIDDVNYLPAGSIISGVIDGLNSPGLFGGVGARADVQRGKFVLGIFGDYNLSEADTEISLSLDGLPVGTAGIDEGDSWVAGGRAGYLFGSDNRALFYVLGGYEQRDVKFTFGDSSTEKTFSGVVAGAGAEYALTDNVFFGVEWQHFFGSKETLFEDDAGLVDPLKVTDDLESDRVMARLRVKLLGGF